MPAPIIKVTDLTKRYGDFTAVDRISFEVKKGDIFAFLGPNGAGKTTTIKMLTTLLRPTGGKMLIAGYDPQSDQHRVRQSFGIVFQDPSLDDELTAQENMRFHGIIYHLSSDLLDARVESLLKFVDLWDKRNQQVKTFSGGMRRRLEIARGLLHHPKIFFLDEPTIGLDPQTRNHIWAYIRELNKKEQITIFFTTHYIEEVEKVANVVAIIDHGKIVATGSPSALKSQTKSKTLEDAYLSLTGKDIREEQISSMENFRQHHRLRRR
jgi:ABC-2 type transport system ATP-binding protein